MKASVSGGTDTSLLDGLGGKSRNPLPKLQTKLHKKAETFGTWNVRTLNADGLPELLTDELEANGISLLGINEMRHIGSGSFNAVSKKGTTFTFYYSGHEKLHTHGVGFAVSPLLVPFVQSFNPISPALPLSS